MPDDGGPDEVLEVLDAAWKKVEEARLLVTYAGLLTENPTERARMTQSRHALRQVEFAIIRLIGIWDLSPIGQKVRQDARSTTR